MPASHKPHGFPRRTLQAGAFALALTVLAGCETMPRGMPSLPFLAQSAPVSPIAALAPPAAREWPDAAQDVLNSVRAALAWSMRLSCSAT